MIANNYIVDSNGNKISVIIPYLEYQKIIEQLEEIEYIKEYLLSKNEKSELIPFESAFESIN